MPAVDQRLGREVRPEPVAGEHDRPAELDPAVVAHDDLDTVERQTVVDAAAAGLGHAVRRDDAHSGGRRTLGERGGQGRAADEDPVVRREVGAGVEQPAQLGRHQRRVVPHVRRHPGGGGDEGVDREAAVEVEHLRPGPRHERADQHGQAGHVRHGQGEQPLTRAAEPVVGRTRRVPHCRGGEQGALRLARGAGRRHDQRDVVVLQRPRGVQRGQYGTAAAARRQREQCRPGAVERRGECRHQRRQDGVAGGGGEPAQLAAQCGSSMSSASGLLICIESTS